MVTTIPPEIWLRTAQFIPSSILQTLYSVNPVFLYLALNERYSEINLAIPWTEATPKYLKHLNHPHIAQRVQRLLLSSDWVETNMFLEPSEKVTFWTTVAWTLPFDLGRFIDPILRRISEVKMRNALMETTVVNFTNVSSLVVVDGCGPSSKTRPGPLLLVNAYAACASNLRTLSLYAMSANFNSLFPPNASILTSLEGVSFTFSPRDGSSADPEAASTFLQAVASTLTTLNISFNTDTSDEPSLLLQRFSRQRTFPKLTTFSLFHSEPLASPSPTLIQFLNQHADTLKCLSLQHARTSPFGSQWPNDLDPSFVPVLPHLETLNIRSGSSYRNIQESASSEGLDAARDYIQHSRGTLTTLGLTHCSFTLHDLSMLLDFLGRGLSGNAEGVGLRKLDITVQILSPQVLDMLAEKLPRLAKLKVNFENLRSNDGGDIPPWTGEGGRAGLEDLTHEDVQPFLLEMKTRLYSKWSLSAFEIDRACLKRDTAKAILMPLTLCIPHLVEIGGPLVKMWREGSTWKECECGND